MNYYFILFYVYKNEKEWFYNSDLNGLKFFDLGEIMVSDVIDIILIEGNLIIGLF